MTIPKIIHQLWIGPKPMPSKFMDTWRDKHPDYEYIRWTEAEISRRGIQFECQREINRMSEINGKADIIRWEILYHYGGIFLDADSICIEPFDESFLSKTAFAGFENENVRKGLVATGTMGFIPKHPLCRAAIDWIRSNDTCPETCGHRAWFTVGPGLLTRLLETGKYSSFMVYPSYTFLPIHFTGDRYSGHKKVYAYQEWGSTKQNYEIMNHIELPNEFKDPSEWVSVLVSSYNTKHMYIHECLESIKNQVGHFGIELVWINDGSDDLSTRLLEIELDKFRQTTRWTKVVYEKMPMNKGISYCLKRGIEMSSNEIIVKMDSDDIMHPDRISKQLQFMKSRPDCVLCGSNVQMFSENPQTNVKQFLQTTNHPPIITWDQYKIVKSHWFMNHPSLCYKKSAILSVGNYNTDMNSMSEDFELELRVLKQYGVVYNIGEPLVYYRIHPDQATYNGKSSTSECNNKRLEVIERVINS
jgi:GT2 family glycosyltransferase